MPIDKLKYLGQCIREARLAAHLTQNEFSDKTHVSVRQIAKIEKGTINPSYEILYALIHALGVSPYILFYPTVSDEYRLKHDIIGYVEMCNSADRMLILKMVQCLSQELSIKHTKKLNIVLYLKSRKHLCLMLLNMNKGSAK